jgi:hypothetical protein
MVKSIGNLASESLWGYVSGIFLGVTNLPTFPPGGSRPWQRTSQTTLPS